MIVDGLFKYFEPVLKQIVNIDIFDYEKAFGINKNYHKTVFHLRNYITYTIRHITFRSRAKKY